MRIFVVLIGFLIGAPAWAQSTDVRLQSRDGNIVIDGSLLGYDGEFYRVDTEYGPLTIDGQGVTCDGPGCPKLDSFVAEVNLSGTRLMADVLIPALIQAFSDRNGYSLLREVEDDTHSTFVISNEDRVIGRFGLRASTSAEGFADLIAEEADIALVLREPRPQEIGLAYSAGFENLFEDRRTRVIAIDGLVAIKATAQPVRSLSLEQLAGVFSGGIESWSALGGEDTPIRIHTPKPDNGLYQAFEDEILSQFGVLISPDAKVQESMEALSDAVSEDLFSVGLTTLSQVGNAEPVPITGSCGSEQRPSLVALRNEDYPLTVPLMMLTPPRRLPLLAREFFGFVSSPAADTVIRRAGFVDQSVVATSFKDQGNRLALAIAQAGGDVTLGDLQRLVDTLRTRQRLSATFRFQGGSVDLDPKSREAVLRLSRALELGNFDERDLLFVGFSDGAGPGGANLDLSRRRAEAVLNLVRAAAPSADLDRVTLGTDAFGEALPIACDDTGWGRAINRRVEVWVK
ncbi:MAG: substrate-binding domain-containing protein [Paracoccaceae bacterium]